MQIAGDIFSILEDIQNIIQENIENQAHHIQVLLADKLDRCKGKENQLVEEYIKKNPKYIPRNTSEYTTTNNSQ